MYCMQCEVLALAFLYAWMNSADSDNVIFFIFQLVIVKKL